VHVQTPHILRKDAAHSISDLLVVLDPYFPLYQKREMGKKEITKYLKRNKMGWTGLERTCNALTMRIKGNHSMKLET
jgi:hypothetical protein